ncbi:MAG: hypothetical protein JWO56_1785 [Acidobacteria bacterium]|nr:hypothetical protein [Acidobacteriota bacterium]
MPIRTHHDLKRLSREELAGFVAENVKHLLEEEALAILANPWVSTPILQTIAQNQRLVGFYSVRLRLAAHRATPQAHAVKLVYYLYWPDLLRLSTDVKVPSTVRRAIDTQLLLRVEKLTLGEKIASARLCSHALIKALLFDPDPNVFASLLINQRLREDDLIFLAGSSRATAEQLATLGSDYKWSYRYAIRKALVLNPRTPRATAASQLRYLSKRDLQQIAGRAETSVYLRRCIERLVPGGGRGRVQD